VVQTGDAIRLDVGQRRLELLLQEDELARRMESREPRRSPHLRGYPKLYIDHVLQCDEGCDFDFLRPANAAELTFVPPIVGRS
jgi:L-arabonate dehydrase